MDVRMSAGCKLRLIKKGKSCRVPDMKMGREKVDNLHLNLRVQFCPLWDNTTLPTRGCHILWMCILRFMVRILSSPSTALWFACATYLSFFSLQIYSNRLASFVFYGFSRVWSPAAGISPHLSDLSLLIRRGMMLWLGTKTDICLQGWRGWHLAQIKFHIQESQCTVILQCVTSRQMVPKLNTVWPFHNVNHTSEHLFFQLIQNL